MKRRHKNKTGDPADKAKATMGIALKGRITYDQYQLLVKNGYEGEIVMKWTCHHANKEITKVIARLNKQQEIEKALLEEIAQYPTPDLA